MSFGSMSFSALGDSLGRFLQPAATVVAVLLFAWAAWLAAQMTWNLLAPANPPAPSASIAAATGSGSQLSPDRIQRMHLFGERGAQPTQTTRTTEAPETTLNIRLVGVTASTVPERSAAIIQQGNNQVVYIPGETISSSRAVLREILSDRVILENAGRMETLYLDGRDGFEPGLTLRQAPAPQTNESTSVQTTEVPLTPQDVSIESIQELVTITPHQQDDELVGYRLAPRANAELFTAAGFQAGDIAISLNGYDLTNVAEAASIMRDLSSLTTATVVVLRDGERVTLELSIPNE